MNTTVEASSVSVGRNRRSARGRPKDRAALDTVVRDTVARETLANDSAARNRLGRVPATSDRVAGFTSSLTSGCHGASASNRSASSLDGIDRPQAGSTADISALPSLARTFDVPEVESEFISFCQLTSHAPCCGNEATLQRLELLRQVANHVRLTEFASADAARSICGSTLLQPLQSEIGVEKWIDASSIYATLCATRLLTAPEERSVMRRMHYFKHLAWQLLTSEAPSDWDLARAHGLARAAMWHRDLLVQANMRLVVSIVKQLPVDRRWHDELVSDGTVALLRAVDKFDPSRGFRFCTYASPAIRHECYLHIKARRLDRDKPTEAEVLPVLAVLHGTGDPSGGDRGGDSNGDIQTDRAHWLAWRDRLAGMMGVLTRREQVIIRARYCLGSHRRVKTLKRLSAALKISKERVRQLEIGALAKLRAAAAIDV